MKIAWHAVELPPTGGGVGHGLCVGVGPALGRDLPLAVFVKGFAWTRRAWVGRATAVVVRYDPRRVPVEADKERQLRAAFEELLQAGELGAEELVPGYVVWPNA